MMSQVRSFPQRAGGAPAPAARLWGVVAVGGRAGESRRDNVVSLTRRPRIAGPRESTQLRRTLDRVASVVAPERLVAVLSRHDAAQYEQDLAAVAGVHRVVQPRHRGSAAETFLPLLKIARLDPEAVVAVLPSDHVASADARVIETVSRAASVAALRPDLAVLVGVDARRPAATYGWVEPGDQLAGLEDLDVRSVRRFVPDRRPGRPIGGPSLLSAPAVVARAATLLDLGRRYLPDVLETLEPLEHVLDAPEERLLCDAVYEYMPYASVARELLERGDHFAVLPAPGALQRESAPEATLLAS